MGHLPDHPHIHREDLGPCMGRHMADAGLPSGHVLRHQGGNFLSGLGDPLGHHPVIGAEHRHRPGRQGTIQIPGEGADLHHCILQKAQSPQRLCNGIPPLPGGPLHLSVGLAAAGRHLLYCHFTSLSLISLYSVSLLKSHTSL